MQIYLGDTKVLKGSNQMPYYPRVYLVFYTGKEPTGLIHIEQNTNEIKIYLPMTFKQLCTALVSAISPVIKLKTDYVSNTENK